jgi:hypothetical protein
MTSPLENLSGDDKPLRQEAFDDVEFAGLRQSGLTRLTDARNTRTRSPGGASGLLAVVIVLC